MWISLVNRSSPERGSELAPEDLERHGTVVLQACAL
jgi:hypothetical protein